MSDKRCGILSAHEPHSWGDLNWCPGSLDPVTVTLSEFLLARIAEDEAVARVATLKPWSVSASGVAVVADDGSGRDVELVVVPDDFPDDPDIRHIARHDPARVLAECEAKKGLITEFSDATLAMRLEMPNVSDLTKYTGTALMVAVKYLALPYADHEDYREEWKP